MATRRIPILGPGTIPDDSGDVFLEPYTVKATNDAWKRLMIVFNDTSGRVGLHGGFAVPRDFVGSPKIIVVWTSTATTGDVEWDFDYRAVGGDDVESLDQSGVSESVNVNDTAPSAGHERMEAVLSLTASNLSADDSVEFALFRDGADAGDTMAAAAIVENVLFEYSDA
jgi:hypothetical protein